MLHKTLINSIRSGIDNNPAKNNLQKPQQEQLLKSIILRAFSRAICHRKQVLKCKNFS